MDKQQRNEKVYKTIQEVKCSCLGACEMHSIEHGDIEYHCIACQTKFKARKTSKGWVKYE